MTKRLTQEQLEAIRKRAEAATGGPWVFVDDLFIAWGDGLIMGDLIAKCEKVADAEFIAHSREDIPALLAEVERLRGVFMHINDCAEEFYVEKGGIYEIPETTPNRDFLQEIFVISAEEALSNDSET